MPYRLIKSADRYRGTFLFLAGVMFVPQGIGYLLSPRPLNSLRGLDWMPSFVSVWHIGAILVGAGLFAALIGLFSKKLRNRAKLISYAYVAAMAAPMMMIILGLWATINGYGEMWLPLMPTYIVLASMIYLGSEWPNPPREPTWPVPSLPPTTAPPEVN